jgi:hypothetical protein
LSSLSIDFKNKKNLFRYLDVLPEAALFIPIKRSIFDQNLAPHALRTSTLSNIHLLLLPLVICPSGADDFADFFW